MTIKLASIAVLTAVFMSMGQLLFKHGANGLNGSSLTQFLPAVVTSPAVIAACVLYAITTVIWVWVLKHVPLSLAYPFTALSYVITPVLSYFLFNEKLNLQFALGSLLLMVGIIICSLSHSSDQALL
ncbi:MAG: EamA family transporter [Gammaproteobacteria bacterium]|nr:EamA family transporter [Gammaproteobacteria bacterium]MCP4982838.1 EamA family transporter [Gammaproteobacteria bacterium]